MPKLKPEQEQAILHNEGNILVSASAGSGKTFVMIERLIRLIVEKKATVKEILAVTFTELSAQDMKEKLKKALISKINDGNEELSSELIEVPTADICTLHSFCSRLLRQYFFTVSISPDFKICDNDQAVILKKESLDKTFRDFYAEQDEEFLLLVNRYRSKRKDDNFKKLILDSFEYLNSETSPLDFEMKYKSLYDKDGFIKLVELYKKYLDERLNAIKEKLETAIDGFTEVGLEKSLEFCKAELDDVERLLSGDLYSIKTYVKRPFRHERKVDEKGTKLIELTKSVHESLNKTIEKFSSYITEKDADLASFSALKTHTRIFYKILNRFIENYANAKADENLLDFGDLERFTLQALNDEKTLESVKQKYKYIFVDEYQDVNGIQETIISKISNDNLFMVGDVKQSIYGFRGCRPEIFAEKFENMQKNGEKTVLLNHNFRSSNAVIDTVNRIFSYSMTKKYSGVDYEKTSKLQAGGIYPDGEYGRSEIHRIEKSVKEKQQKEEKVYNIWDEIREKDEETSAISSLLAKIISEEVNEKEYYDSKENCRRKVRFSDVAILTRNKKNDYIEGLVSGLIRHNIPVTSEVRENVCDFPEIITLINALKLIDCFRQSIPLVVTLKSPLGKFSEEDLARIVLFYYENSQTNGKKSNGDTFVEAFFFYLENTAVQSEESENVDAQNLDSERLSLPKRVKNFYEYFEKIRFVADFIGASGVLEKLVRDSGYENYLLASEFGREKSKRLHGFISASKVDGKTYAVREFLKKIENCKEAFELGGGVEEDSVKVMTIHASKGLEFPVVIVCGLEKKANKTDETEEIVRDREFGLAVKYYDEKAKTVSETLLRGVIAEKKNIDRINEELRLFYVAMTRAEYSIHLTFESNKERKDADFIDVSKFIDYVPSDMEMTEVSAEDLAFVDIKNQKRNVLVGTTDEKIVQKMREKFGYEYPFADDTTLPLKSSVTKAVGEINKDFYPTHLLFEDETFNKESGIIAHRLLENLDFSKISDFYGQTQKMQTRGILTGEELQKINLERIKNAIVRAKLDTLSGYTLYREQDFICEIEASKIFDVKSSEKALLQGVIDLLAINGDSAIIVDYKYSSLDADSLKGKYAKQLELYSYATEKLLGVKVSRKILINIFTGESVFVD